MMRPETRRDVPALDPLAENDRWMARALELARQGVALAHPNPMVGAVVVQDGRAVGEGFHTFEGQRHAEVIALAAAADAGRGATLYLNLEPCCHTGRTGPCTDAILAAGIRRVVAAMTDPNPQVSGRGIAQLTNAGVAVEVGARQQEARRLNEAFARWIRARRPLVTLKSGMTLDGRVASPRASEKWITARESREEVQRLRHAADAVMTGIGTVLHDDPLLTDRTGLARRRPLLRVVLDSELRLPLRSKLVKSATDDVLVFTRQPADSRKARALGRAGGIEIISLRGRGKDISLEKVVEKLGEREILSAMIEAGPGLVSAALRAGVVDKVVLFIAPKLLGGDALPLVREGFASLEAAPELRELTVRRCGPDLAVEGYLRDVYGNY